MKSDTSWKCIFKNAFQYITARKTLEATAKQNMNQLKLRYKKKNKKAQIKFMCNGFSEKKID